MRRRLKLLLTGVVVLALVIAAVFFGLPIYHILHGLGYFDHAEMQKYNATNDGNLQALRKAFLAYHESEGQFPDAPKWMDEVKSRIQEGDMEKEETSKKLVNPMYPAKAGVYGYAMNDAASGKYEGDLKSSTILIFDSSDTSWNAHGNPAKLKPANAGQGGDEGITVEGKIVKLN